MDWDSYGCRMRSSPQYLMQKELKKLKNKPHVGDPWQDTVITNCGPFITRKWAHELKRTNKRATHAAFNFNGQVWYENGLWHEIVFRYHVPINHYTARTLTELMRKVNNDLGWE